MEAVQDDSSICFLLIKKQTFFRVYRYCCSIFAGKATHVLSTGVIDSSVQNLAAYFSVFHCSSNNWMSCVLLLALLMKLGQSCGVFVFAPARRKVGDVPLRALSYDFIEHDLYVSVTKSTRFFFGSLLKTCSTSSSNVSGIGLKLCSIAFPSMIWTASDGLSVIGLMPDSRICRSFDLSVLVGMPSAVARDQGTGPRGNDNVNLRSRSCSRERSTN